MQLGNTKGQIHVPTCNVIKFKYSTHMRANVESAPSYWRHWLFHEPQQADFWAAWPPLAAWSGWLILIVWGWTTTEDNIIIQHQQRSNNFMNFLWRVSIKKPQYISSTILKTKRSWYLIGHMEENKRSTTYLSLRICVSKPLLDISGYWKENFLHIHVCLCTLQVFFQYKK